MINLLPLSHKKEIKKEYTRRFIVIFGFFFVIGALIELVFCFSLFSRTDSYFRGLEKELKLAKKVSALNKMEDMERRVDDLNHLLVIYEDNRNKRRSPTSEISLILSVLPESIVIDSFIFDKDIKNQTNKEIALAGTAVRRDVFLSFVEALRKIPLFKEVESPVSNLLKEGDMKFSLHIRLDDFEKE